MTPFDSTAAGTVSEWGEMRLIEAVREWLGDASPPSPEGIGDDCAVFSSTPGSRCLVTTDPILWKRHFDEQVTPEQAAGKLLKRNLSDIAAMGGRPLTAMISLLLPPETSIDWLERFYLGLRDCALQFNVPIGGGDISQSENLAATLTLIGETVGPRPLTRHGAAAGDQLFVTGKLGGSLLGGHFNFEPRLPEGEWLAKCPEITAAIDVSDGLAKEIPLLLPDDCRADLDPGAIPIAPEAETMAKQSGKSALFHALCDGEDYELLFAVNPKSADALVSDWEKQFATPLSRIGSLSLRDKSSSQRLHGLPDDLIHALNPYEHFR